jgi:hypothetical protein
VNFLTSWTSFRFLRTTLFHVVSKFFSLFVKVCMYILYIFKFLNCKVFVRINN